VRLHDEQVAAVEEIAGVGEAGSVRSCAMLEPLERLHAGFA
jgi:hypothetical protein